MLRAKMPPPMNSRSAAFWVWQPSASHSGCVITDEAPQSTLPISQCRGPACRMKDYPMKALLDSLQPGDSEWLLAKAIDPERLPAHIAVIMDGNGRWANRRNLPRVAGHRAGIDPVRSTVETCARLGIRALTLYAFSVENWKRPKHE